MEINTLIIKFIEYYKESLQFACTDINLLEINIILVKNISIIERF